MSRDRILTFLAFSAIYFIWGSRFLAIRIAVETVPPLFAASLRFFLPGGLLYLWARAHGETKPCPREWRSVAIQAALLFLISYGGLFWAEKTIPSGIASILTATVPAWTALLQVCVLRKESFRWSLPAGVALRLAGVIVLTFTPRRTPQSQGLFGSPGRPSLMVARDGSPQPGGGADPWSLVWE